MSGVSVSDLRNYFLGLQDRITNKIAEIDGKPFLEDAWQKPEDSPLKGNGRSRI